MRNPVPKKETGCVHISYYTRHFPKPQPAWSRSLHQPRAGAAKLSPLSPVPGSKRHGLFACGSSRGPRSREGIVPKSRPQRRGESKGGREAKLERGEE